MIRCLTFLSPLANDNETYSREGCSITAAPDHGNAKAMWYFNWRHDHGQLCSNQTIFPFMLLPRTYHPGNTIVRVVFMAPLTWQFNSMNKGCKSSTCPIVLVVDFVSSLLRSKIAQLLAPVNSFRETNNCVMPWSYCVVNCSCRSCSIP